MISYCICNSYNTHRKYLCLNSAWHVIQKNLTDWKSQNYRLHFHDKIPCIATMSWSLYIINSCYNHSIRVKAWNCYNISICHPKTIRNLWVITAITLPKTSSDSTWTVQNEHLFGLNLLGGATQEYRYNYQKCSYSISKSQIWPSFFLITKSTLVTWS